MASDPGAASRQLATASSRAAGLNGFCRLEIAPSLVAMLRKSGAGPDSDRMGLPEITIMGTSGRCACISRMVSMPSIPGMKISRNSRSNSSASNSANPLRPSLAATTRWPARSSRSWMVIRTAPSSSTIRILAMPAVPKPRARRPVESPDGVNVRL